MSDNIYEADWLKYAVPSEKHSSNFLDSKNKYDGCSMYKPVAGQFNPKKFIPRQFVPRQFIPKKFIPSDSLSPETVYPQTSLSPRQFIPSDSLSPK